MDREQSTKQKPNTSVNEFSPPLRLNIDLGAIEHNWQMLSGLCGTSQTGAAVKADAYGLGSNQVSSRLYRAGCRDFFVAHWAEALELRGTVPAEQISVLNGVQQQDVLFAQQLGAKPVLNSLQQAKLWKESGGGVCDLMIDTGMNRLGIEAHDIETIRSFGLQIDVVMSHLASADERSQQNDVQLSNFLEFSSSFPTSRKSLANSAAIALGSRFQFDLTRPGIALYGGTPRAELVSAIRNVVFPQARVCQIRTFAAGDRVGYNATFTASQPMSAAIVEIGYADGYPRSLSNSGKFQMAGEPLTVIGRVSMDLTIVQLPENHTLREGDYLDVCFELETISELSGRSPYEILTSLGRRFQRVYKT